jgi:hypothetical protein
MSVRRQILALAGSYGILDHNTAVKLPARYTLESLQKLGERHQISVHELDVKALATDGYLNSRDTGYYGYGDYYVEGSVVYWITPKGLIALWTGSPV